MNNYLLLAIFGTFIASISQILLKQGAIRTKSKTILLSFLNFFTISGYFLFGIVILINIYAFQKLDIKITPILVALNFINLLFLSRIILKEKINKKSIFAVAVILIGIAVFNLNSFL